MSMLTQPQAEFPEIGEDAVAEYLSGHPDFFERHLNLLSGMKLQHRTSGAAISLVERQVEVLRQRNAALEGKLRELLDVAHTNDRLAARIHTMALRLMRVRTREEVIGIVEEQLREGFAVDRAVIIFFDSVPGLMQTVSPFVKVVNREDPSVGPFKSFLQASAPRCGPVRDAQRDFLFGPDGGALKSMALVPLGPRSEFGFLAIGSHDVDHFHPGKSIDFLARLGELVACALRTH
jgi:uncharacterized protein YigA (DUF484 family)